MGYRSMLPSVRTIFLWFALPTYSVSVECVLVSMVLTVPLQGEKANRDYGVISAEAGHWFLQLHDA